MTKQRLRSFWLGLSAGAGIAMIAAGLAFTSTESLLKSSFASALTRNDVAVKQVASQAPIAGSESFWLSAMRQDGNGPITKTVAIGDKISLTLGGERRTLEVATVKDFAPQTTEIDTSAGPSHFVLVTARDINDQSARPVRFVMELEQGNAPLVGSRNGRTL